MSNLQREKTEPINPIELKQDDDYYSPPNEINIVIDRFSKQNEIGVNALILPQISSSGIQSEKENFTEDNLDLGSKFNNF